MRSAVVGVDYIAAELLVGDHLRTRRTCVVVHSGEQRVYNNDDKRHTLIALHEGRGYVHQREDGQGVVGAEESERALELAVDGPETALKPA